MTTPVTTLVTSTTGGTSMTMCFFLGDSSKTWPQPTDPAVFLKTEEQRSIITRYYSLVTTCLVSKPFTYSLYYIICLFLQDYLWVHDDLHLDHGGGDSLLHAGRAGARCGGRQVGRRHMHN